MRAGSPIGKRSGPARRTRPGRRSASGKRSPKRWLRVALSFTVVIAFLAFGGYTTIKTVLLSQLVGVVVARDGQVEDLVDGKAYIIRHELILRSPVTGTITLALEEGSRTRRDAEVANLSDVEERQQAEARVSQLTADLAAFNNSNSAEEASLVLAIGEASAQAEAGAAALRAACLGSDFPTIDREVAQLGTLVQRRNDASDRLATIRKDRSKIEAALATSKAALEQAIFPVLSPEAGVVSYRLDGLEETLTPESIGQYGTKQLVTMARRTAAIADQSRVQAGDSVAKIIGDAEAYVSTIVTNAEADRLALAGDATLRFPGFEGRRETEASLFHVGDREKNGYCVVTYLAHELLEGMVSARQVDVTVVAHVYSGTVLPSKAIVHRGGQDGVFIMEGGIVCRFRPVDIVGGSGGEVVVDGILPGTQVISTPWLVREGTRIGSRRGVESRA